MFICTGNRFRSPLAAALLEARSAAISGQIEVRSAGVLDVGGRPALPEAIELGRRYGVDLRPHLSSVLEQGSLARTDLVIGFERIHVATAVIDGGAPRERVFTLPKLVDLLGSITVGLVGDPRAHAKEALERVAAVRPKDQLHQVQEVADPLGGPPRGYDRAATRIAELVQRLTPQLFGIGSGQRPR